MLLNDKSDFGQLGLRAIATSRYSFGFYGAKLCSVLNVVIGGGFAVVNVVVVGQILSAVSNYTMTIAVGCIIIAVIGYVISVFGFALPYLSRRPTPPRRNSPGAESTGKTPSVPYCGR